MRRDTAIKLKLYFAGLVFLIFISCGNDTQSDIANTYQIEFEQLKTDTICMEDFIQDIEIIPLETKDECLISNVGKLSVTDSGFVIFDWGAKEKVLCFSEDGKFRNQIGRLGHGRGEYSFVFDVCTNRKGEKIAIATPDGVSLYDSNGNFIKSYQLFEDAYARQVAMTSSELVCSSLFSGDDYQLHLYDDNMSIKEEYLSTAGHIISLPTVSENYLSVSGSKLCYCDYYHSTVYVIDTDKKSDSIKKYKFTGPDFLDYTDNNMKKYISDNNYSFIHNFQFDGAAIIGDIVDSKQNGYRCRIDLQTDEVKIIEFDEWLPQVMDIYNGCYYTILSQNMFLDIVNGDMYPYEFFYFSNLLRKKYLESDLNVNEMSNYVLLKINKREN